MQDLPGTTSRRRSLPVSRRDALRYATAVSALHQEMGLVCSDQQLVYQATDYLRTLIKQSEPTTSGCAGPEPSLVYVEEPEPDFEEMAEWDARSEESHAEAEQLDDDEN